MVPVLTSNKTSFDVELYPVTNSVEPTQAVVVGVSWASLYFSAYVNSCARDGGELYSAPANFQKPTVPSALADSRKF